MCSKIFYCIIGKKIIYINYFFSNFINIFLCIKFHDVCGCLRRRRNLNPTTIWCFLKTTSSRIRKSRYRVSTTSMDQETHVLLGRLFFFFTIFLQYLAWHLQYKKLQARTSHRLPVYRREGTRKPKLV